MKIAVYGLPCSGKTTLLGTIQNATVLHGSSELNRLANGSFSELSELEKIDIRVQYVNYVNSLTDNCIISDGHYSFLDNVVFTEHDGNLYDVFFYLYCRPEVIVQRLSVSEKNQHFSNLSIESISQWQDFEIESLRRECHNRDKDFYVISDSEKDSVFSEFLSMVLNGFSNRVHAYGIVDEITKLYSNEEPVYLVDGDKTLIEQDSYRICCSGQTRVFDGDFYTGYQAYLFNKEIMQKNEEIHFLENIALNSIVWNLIQNKRIVVLSSGLSSIWEMIGHRFSLPCVIADTLISADTKYFVAKKLKEQGYKIVSFGDSKNDVYMLKESDEGFLYIGKRISRSLKNVNLDGVRLLYDKTPFFLTSDSGETIENDVMTCKSNSGINGGKLAGAHIRLGQELGKKLAEQFPSKNTAVLVLERGGRFFGDGLYSTFGGVFYSFKPSSEEIPVITQDRIVIVDSVINTGKSIIKLIDTIKEYRPDAEIVVATNVIQEEAVDLFQCYKIFAVRISKNSFVGKRQAKQIGRTGPDTADRLFNMIDCCNF